MDAIPQMLQIVPVFLLVFCRVAGMMLSAPLFGNARIPRRVKLLLSLVLAFGLSQSISRPHLPETTWELAVGIGGEILFGLAMGMALNFVFVAVTWAGEIIGQQMGISLGETFDPAFGQSATIISDLYTLLTLTIFLAAQGHRHMLLGVRQSFAALPLLSVGISVPLFGLMLHLLEATTALGMQLAGPVLLTMLVVDLVLGFVGKTMPQFNVMTAGTSIKSAVGILILMIALSISSRTIEASVFDSLESVRSAWVALR